MGKGVWTGEWSKHTSPPTMSPISQIDIIQFNITATKSSKLKHNIFTLTNTIMEAKHNFTIVTCYKIRKCRAGSVAGVNDQGGQKDEA